MDYYALVGKNSRTVAIAESADDLDELDVWDLVESITDPSEWQKIDLELTEGELVDLQPTDILGSVCSPRLSDLLRRYSDETMALPIEFRRGSERYSYYFIRPPVVDVLDRSRSEFAGGSLLKPYLSQDRVGSCGDVFCIDPLVWSPIVSSRVKDEIVRAGGTGISFDLIHTS